MRDPSLVQRRRPSASALLPWVVFGLGLLFTAGASLRLWQIARQKDRERFDAAVAQTSDAIQDRIETHVAMLRGGAALFDASETVTLKEFRDYVDRLELRTNYPGIQGIGWTLRVPALELLDRLTAIRAEVGPAFAITPEAPLRPEYHTIVYLEPLDERNRAAIGFDMFTDAVRREAMERARDMGEPAASGKVVLVQEIDADKQAGFLIYLPVYRAGGIPPNPETRRTELAGFVYSPLRADDLLEGVFRGRRDPRLDFRVYDGATDQAEALLHDSSLWTPARPAPTLLPPPVFRSQQTINVAGRAWTLVFESRPELGLGSSVAFVPFVAVAGVAVSLALFAISWTQVRARQEAGEERERFRTTLASIGDAVIATDVHGRVTFINPVAAALAGWEMPEALGRPIEEVFRIAREGTDEAVESPVARVLREGRIVGLANHTVLQRRDGVRLPIDDSGAPIAGAAGGAPVGAVLVFRDVTARREAEKAARERTVLLEAWNEISGAFASEPDLEHVVQTVTDVTTRLTGAQFGAFFYNVTDERGESYALYTVSGVPREAFAKFPMPRNTAVFGPTFRGEAVVRSDDITRDPRYGRNPPHRGMPEGHLPVRSYLAVPVVSRSGAVLGGLFFGHSETGVFAAHHERLIVGLAAQAAVAIDNARLYRDLQRSEERYRTLVSQVEDYAIFAVDPEGRAVSWNRGVEKVLGWSEQEFIGLPATAIFTPEDVAAGIPEQELAVAAAEGVASNDRWMRRKDGRRFWAAGATTRLTDESGRVIGFTKVMRDQTELKRAIDALEESEARFRVMADHAPVLIWKAQGDCERYFFNRTWLEFTGCALEDEAGGGWLDQVHPDDRERLVQQTREACERRVPFSVEYRLRRADGQYRWLLERGVPVGRAGEPSRPPQPERSEPSPGDWMAGQRGRTPTFVGSCIDITDIVEARAALARHRDELQRLVAQRTEELEASHQRLRLSERMAAIGTLSAGLGHDMGNLLLPIRARLDVLEAVLDSDAHLREHLEAIRKSTDYLQALTNGLRLLALDPDDARASGLGADLRAWWTDAASMYRNVLPRGVALEASIPNDLPPVAVAPHRLTQAVLNLMTNAADVLRPRGDGRVRVEARLADGADARDLPPDAQTRRFVRLSVIDDGPGMPPEVRDRAMEPFFTTKTRGISTGLGLSLVHSVAQSAGGALRIDSTPGQGTTVSLILPALDIGARRRERPGPRRVPTAVISMRDARVAGFIRALLASQGYEVVVHSQAAPGSAGPERDPMIASLWILDPTSPLAAEMEAFARQGDGRHVVYLGGRQAGIDEDGGPILALGPRPPTQAIRQALATAMMAAS